ncbi:hypothetical protein bmyco0003_54590 [Bacillus pseudomycoides]|nr:hypothetical protein bmyco0003_54590 [Bacillus pseudomycoides]
MTIKPILLLKQVNSIPQDMPLRVKNFKQYHWYIKKWNWNMLWLKSF